ncbi:MAG: sigma-70 family RNA polymerase sigma factor, partial [Candidatus Marinimicrobia bacterium]|nr:sigma-70 family RNA polymerase sigma factor [Candidatus Neomarinimicrobiota bacterium]
LARFDAQKSFTTWLVRIVSNLDTDLLRKRQKQGGRLTSWSEKDDFIADESSHDEALQIAMTIRYKAARLPLKQQLVFVLRDLQELSVAEVAKILDISPEAVKTNLHYARHALRKSLEADFGS